MTFLTVWMIPARRGAGRPAGPILLAHDLRDARIGRSEQQPESVPQRVATTLLTLTPEHESSPLPLRPGAKHPQVALTHEQLAALVGTSRETVTKVLHQFADRGLIRLARGRVTVLKTEQLRDQTG